MKTSEPIEQKLLRGSRNPYFDYLRGISALLVLFFHWTTRYDMLFGHLGDYPIMVSRGSFAVLMFFLLSGYLSFRNIDKYQPKQFAKNRFFRLYPTYWICMVITAIIILLFMPNESVSIKDFFLNLTMLQMYLGADYIDGAYWTLSCEVLFYCLIIVVLLLKKGRYSMHVILGWFALQVFLLILPDTSLFIIVKKINRFMYFHCFMAGGVIAVLEKQRIKKEKDSNTLLSNIILCIALFFFVSQQFIDHEIDSGIFMAISVFLLCISIAINSKLGGGRKSDSQDSFTSFMDCIDFLPSIPSTSKYWLCHY